MTTILDFADFPLLDGVPVPPIFGGEGGQMGIVPAGDALATHTADGVDLNTIWAELVAGFDAWNQHRTDLTSLLSFRTVVPGEAVPQNISSPSFEQLTEFGVPNAAGVPSSALVLGYDFGDFGLRSAFTWQALRRMTAEQVYASINGIMHSDNRLVTGTILKRLFDPTQKVNAEGYMCRGLYNADGQYVPPHLGNEFDPDTTTHYWKSGATQLDSGDIEDALKAIRAKGYGVEATSQILILASQIESEHIQTFRQGEESRTGGPIAKQSFIPSKKAPAYLQPDNIVGEPIDGDFHGIECLGSYGPAWLVETAFIPAGYIAVVATGGPNSQNNVVGVREHPIESYRGLLAVPGNTAYPMTDSTYIRSFGVGVRQRGAAVAIQIGTGTTYTPPTITL
ncbi:hypothetical protein [Mycolicibacterium confluentis]|uniref:Bacteriophage protein n=1 Tax=Mycolicibacterium confluentis TaxID=28047 RepID=A0A7I7XXS9_9MYCO|nr:hypothetical protein [Mycolicibacterium confluentis]BBZ34119.1 hypothetical protein MCNF_27240 [Mycolicibacterium confluentis]